MIPAGINCGKRFLFLRNFGSLSWMRLALTNVQYAVSCPQKAYESQGDRVSERWNSIINTSWQLPAPLAAIFLFPLREFPEALAIIHTLLFFCSVPHKLCRCSPQRLTHDRLTHSQSFFMDFCLYFFSSLHTRDSRFDTPTCCEFQIRLSGLWGRGGGLWRESLRG